MDWFTKLYELVEETEQRLPAFVEEYGAAIYALLAVAVFLETAVFLAAFLPGDTLVFAAGAVAGQGLLNPFVLIPLMTLASAAGDTLNFWLGRWFSGPLLHRGWVRKEQVERSRDYFNRYGARTIIIGRYIPVIRVVVPFVAGTSRIRYLHFLPLSLIACASWMTLWVGGAYWFGQLDFVQDNLVWIGAAVIVIAVVPLTPTTIRYIKHIRGRSSQAPAPD